MLIQKITRYFFALTFIFIFSSALHAQKKEFTQEQLLKNKMPDIISPMPIVNWDGDNQLVISKRENKDSPMQKFLFDFKTRKEMPYVTPGKTVSGIKKSVFTKGTDLYYKVNDEAEVRLTNDSNKKLNPTFSPDSNYIAYTKNNNLFIVDVNAKKETQITTDGSETILNGYSSWVYMEEILGRATRYKAFWWSPDSKHIAFFRSDESEVPVFILTNAAGMHGEVEKTRYPQPGDKNPEVKIGIATVTGSPVIWADFNEKDDQYFGMPYFKNDGSLLVQWLNRAQSNLKIYDVNLNSGKKKIFYEEQQKTWIDLDDNDRLSFLKSGNVLMLSDKTGWRHIYYLDVNGKEINAVTSGKFTVKDITFVDEKNSTIYFTARGLENTATMDFYKVGFNGKNFKRLTFGDYNNRVQMSPNGKYFITNYSNANTPSKMALLNNDGVKIADLGDSKGSEFDNYNIAKTELIRVKSDDGLYDLPAMVTWPTNMDPNKKYPVLISIYGGPNAGTVWNSFNFSGTQQWYAKEGLIQIAMDHRASGQFGKEGVNYMYHNLGYWEMKDYSTIVKYLIANKQADPEKICITGFSYGGYMSCYALTYGADVFKYAMAGGSVTDWSLYDSHYTEKFMGTPQNNPEGYKSSSVFTWVDKYKGGLQIVHGEIDDNVHLQNTLQLISKLQDQKKNFELMIYPGGRHGWGGNKGAHFANLKTDFIYKNLLEKEVPKDLLR